MFFLIILRWTYPKVCPANADLIDWNEIDLIEFLTIYSEVFTLSSIVSQLSVLSCDIVIRRIKLEYCTTFINPGRFTLYAPELPLTILDDWVVPLVAAIWGKNYILSDWQRQIKYNRHILNVNMRHKASISYLGLTSGVTFSMVCSSHYCSEVQLVSTRDDEDFLTSEEACKRLNVSSRTLERYVRDGLLQKYRRRIGREVFYRRSEVEDLLRIRPAEDIEDQ